MKIIRWTKFKKVIEFLVSWEDLPEKYKDHKLKWRYSKFRECHIKLDLLLVYEVDNDELILYLFRLWTHSEIF